MKKLALILSILMIISLVACTPEPAPEGTVGTDTAPAETGGTDAATKPAAPDENDTKEFTIGVFVWSYSDTWPSVVKNEIESWGPKLAADRGIKLKLELFDAGNDQAKMNDQIEVMLSKKVDLLCVNMVDNATGKIIQDMAAAHKIPVLFYDKEPVETNIINDYEFGSIFVGTRPEQAGILQGENAIEVWNSNPAYDKNGDGVMQYILFEGEPGNIMSILRSEYVIKTIEEAGIKTELLGGEWLVCDWLTHLAMDQMTAVWASYGDKIEMIFSNNDDMAIGAISALQNEAGYNLGTSDQAGYIPVFGVDATAAAQEAIKNGIMEGSVLQDASAQGKAVVELSINKLLTGDWLSGSDYTLAEDGYSIRIPYVTYSR